MLTLFPPFRIVIRCSSSSSRYTLRDCDFIWISLVEIVPAIAIESDPLWNGARDCDGNPCSIQQGRHSLFLLCFIYACGDNEISAQWILQAFVAAAAAHLVWRRGRNNSVVWLRIIQIGLSWFLSPSVAKWMGIICFLIINILWAAYCSFDTFLGWIDSSEGSFQIPYLYLPFFQYYTVFNRKLTPRGCERGIGIIVPLPTYGKGCFGI